MFNLEPSLTYRISDDEYADKVRVYMQTTVRKNSTDLLELYKKSNWLGVSFFLVVSDPEYTMSKCVSLFYEYLHGRLKEMTGGKFGRPKSLREISYGLADERRLTGGYETVTKPARFRSLISNFYSRYFADAGVAMATTNKQGLAPFSFTEYLKIMRHVGACAEQQGQGLARLEVPVGPDGMDHDAAQAVGVVRLALPHCTALLSMDEAHPNVLAQQYFPWEGVMRHVVLRSYKRVSVADLPDIIAQQLHLHHVQVPRFLSGPRNRERWP